MEQVAFKPHSLFPDKVVWFWVPLYATGNCLGQKCYFHSGRFTLGFSIGARQFCLASVCFEQVSVIVNTVSGQKEGDEKNKISCMCFIIHTYKMQVAVVPRQSELTVKGTFYPEYFW